MTQEYLHAEVHPVMHGNALNEGGQDWDTEKFVLRRSASDPYLGIRGSTIEYPD